VIEYIYNEDLQLKEIISEYATNLDENLFDLSNNKPVLIVFLRHLGCPFCKEFLQTISESENKIKEKNIELCFVHMSDDKVAKSELQKFQFKLLRTISDANADLYHVFGLKNATFSQLFDINNLWRSLKVTIKNGASLKKSYGNTFQTQGIFLLHKGEIISSFVPKTVSQKPDLSVFLKE
jgi:thiol-disulfide isomerase/thioredoxin